MRFGYFNSLRLCVSLLVWAVQGTSQAIPPGHVDDFSGHPRVLIMSDIGNEPDDQMSLTRLLLYSNQMDIEALIASTSTWQKSVVHPETMRGLVQAYGRVRPNLQLHASGWPSADELNLRIYSGQPGYGLAATGPDRMSEGPFGAGGKLFKTISQRA